MIKLIALLTRKPGISREEFAQYWVHEHTKITSQFPGCLGYRINIATERQPVETVGEPIYDGTAELWWESIDAMEAALAGEVGLAGGADADKFSEIRIHLYTEEHIVIPDRFTR